MTVNFNKNFALCNFIDILFFHDSTEPDDIVKMSLIVSSIDKLSE